jgi:hypothetical protein
MIPRTDQFKERRDGTIDICGVAWPLDQLTYLLQKLDAFLSLCSTLPRGSDGSYLVRDPRAGKIGSVRSRWEQVQRAAQIVWSSTLVPETVQHPAPDIAFAAVSPSSSDAPVADLARQLVFVALGPEAESAIPATIMERIHNMRDRVESLVMPAQIEIRKALQADLHRWSRDTRVRAWIKKQIIPELERMWTEQKRRQREQRLIDKEIGDRRRAAIEAGLPFTERPRVVYDRDLDPRHMTAQTIGRLRDEGRTEIADIAEAFQVLMLHDAGEAGCLDKLFPRLGEYEGFDMAYQHRCDTGLEREEEGPQFSPEAMEGMLARFRARFRPGGLKSRNNRRRKQTAGPRPLTQVERLTHETVTRHGGNFSAAAKELKRAAKTVRENYARACSKIDSATGSRSVALRRTLPQDRRGNTIVEDATQGWSYGEDAFTMNDDET